MHPILFRIPLPKMPLMLWWGLAAVCAIALVMALVSLRKSDRSSAAVALVAAAGAGIAAYAFRATKFEAESLPIYSYGVMLGLSLVIGWYLTLTLAEKDGLPKETMANCYVVTALAAIAGSRILYVATNPDEFKQFSDIFALRRGGLVAYGGFLGGLLGSWLYLRANKIRLMPWADVAVPSLASGLLVTRIGCYLFGCDFGKRLPEGAPGFLKRMGTFPKWGEGMLDGPTGSPAFVKHLDVYRGTETGAEILKAGASLPVHPTQIYESIVGGLLLAFLLWQRRHQKFRGQIFFLFAFGYGYLRFLLEILRDDSERGELGPRIAEHWFVAGALLALAVAFTFGVALGIKDARARLVARVLAFVPPVVAFVALKPMSFAKQVTVQLSTSQWIGLLSALIVSYFYAQLWNEARKNPRVAMGPASLGELDTDDEPKKKKRKKKKAADVVETAAVAEANDGATEPMAMPSDAPPGAADQDDDEDEDDETKPDEGAA